MNAEPAFEIGDLVVFASQMAALKAAARFAGFEPSAVFPGQVSERRLQECHGGVNQTHYALVGESGLYPELALVPYEDYVGEHARQALSRTVQKTTLAHDVARLATQIAGLEVVVDALGKYALWPEREQLGAPLRAELAQLRARVEDIELRARIDNVGRGSGAREEG